VLKPGSSLDPVNICRFALGLVAPQCSGIVTDAIFESAKLKLEAQRRLDREDLLAQGSCGIT